MPSVTSPTSPIEARPFPDVDPMAAVYRLDSPEVVIALLRRTREYRFELLRTSGDYGITFCPVCRCGKSGAIDVPNRRQDPCLTAQCPCHEEIEVPA